MILKFCNFVEKSSFFSEEWRGLQYWEVWQESLVCWVYWESMEWAWMAVEELWAYECVCESVKYMYMYVCLCECVCVHVNECAYA